MLVWSTSEPTSFLLFLRWLTSRLRKRPRTSSLRFRAPLERRCSVGPFARSHSVNWYARNTNWFRLVWSHRWNTLSSALNVFLLSLKSRLPPVLSSVSSHKKTIWVSEIWFFASSLPDIFFKSASPLQGKTDLNLFQTHPGH